jgi:methionine synthase II (cobalamin-independent)
MSEQDEARKKRIALLGKVVAATLVALPGAYGAVRGATSADGSTVELERKLRDRQEAALQQHVRALRTEIDALRKATVSHKELLELALRLRNRARVVRPRSPTRRTEVSEREQELEREIAALKRKQKAAEKAEKTAERATKLPALRSAPALRQDLQKKLDL